MDIKLDDALFYGYDDTVDLATLSPNFARCNAANFACLATCEFMTSLPGALLEGFLWPEACTDSNVIDRWQIKLRREERRSSRWWRSSRYWPAIWTLSSCVRVYWRDGRAKSPDPDRNVLKQNWVDTQGNHSSWRRLKASSIAYNASRTVFRSRFSVLLFSFTH